MIGANTETLEERLKGALAHPSERSTLAPIGELMTRIIAHFTNPVQRTAIEPTCSAAYRQAAAG